MRKEYEASGKTVDAAIDAACLLANTTVDMLEIEVLEFGSKGLFGLGQKDARVRVYVEVEDQDQEEKSLPSAAEKPAGSSFGFKKSKRERFEQKQKQKQSQTIEIKPVITIDDVPAEEIASELAKQQKTASRRPKAAADNAEPQPEQERERERRESRATAITEGEMAERYTREAMLFLLPVFEELDVEPKMQAEVKNGILWLNFSGKNMGLLIGRRGETLDALQYLCNLVVNKKHREHVRLILNVEDYREGREETIVALARRMANKVVETGRRVELKPMNPHERRLVHIALQEDRRVETSSHGEEPYRRIVISSMRNRRDRKRNYPPRQKRSNSEQ